MTSDEFARLRTASGDHLVRLIHEVPAHSLLQVLENPSLDETSLALLLQRRDLQSEFLEEVLKRRHFLKNYPVKKLLESEARNSTAGAISCGSPTLPKGVNCNQRSYHSLFAIPP